MKLFIYEHLTSGALAEQDYSESLSHEGDAMLQAVVSDLIELGYPISIIRDRRLSAENFQHADNLNIMWVDTLKQFHDLWHQSLRQYDYFLVIAPETNNILATLAQQIVQSQKIFLGCDLQSIKTSSNKYLSWTALRQQHLACPETWLDDAWLAQTNSPQDWVVKPIDGAGSENTFVLDTEQAQKLLTHSDPRLSFVVQPYIKGIPLSLSLFVTRSQTHLLSINQQVMQLTQQQLCLDHCIVSATTPLSPEQAMTLATSVVKAIPGLWGFVGIDLIWTAEQCWIIEINPRLTSSYAEAEMRRERNPARHLHEFLQSNQFNRQQINGI